MKVDHNILVSNLFSSYSPCAVWRVPKTDGQASEILLAEGNWAKTNVETDWQPGFYLAPFNLEGINTENGQPLEYIPCNEPVELDLDEVTT